MARRIEVALVLIDKLLEEHVELLASESLDEIVDMVEVLFALARQLGHDEEAISDRRKAKREERGGFDGALYLTQILAGRGLKGSLIGGIAEMQEMLDHCAKHGVASDVEVIPIQKVNEAYERVLKSDVRYRFVIDLNSLKS